MTKTRKMNSRYTNLYTFFYFLFLIAGCSNQASIKSVSEDQVVIIGPPERFVEAYTMADRECQKNVRNTKYAPDETSSLNVVTFDCLEPVQEETAVEETEEVSEEEEIPSEETEEISTEPETSS